MTRGFSWIFILFAVGLVAISIFAYVYARNTFFHSVPPRPAYVPGEILVGIKSGNTIGAAKQLISSYNLKYDLANPIDVVNQKEIPYHDEDIVGERPVFFTVTVPVGDEQKWILTFQSSPIVKYAELDGYMYLQ